MVYSCRPAIDLLKHLEKATGLYGYRRASGSKLVEVIFAIVDFLFVCLFLIECISQAFCRDCSCSKSSPDFWKWNFYMNFLLTVSWPVRCANWSADGAVFQCHIKRADATDRCFNFHGHKPIISNRTLQDFWFSAFFTQISSFRW